MCIIIIGSGITGNILSLAISHFTNNLIPIYIIESKTYKQQLIKNDNKYIVLNHQTYKNLLKIKLWKNIKYFTTSIKNIEITEYKNFGFLNFNAKDYLINSLGYVIELHKIHKATINLMKKKKNINLFYSKTIHKCFFNKKNVILELNNGVCLKSKLIVLASGDADENILKLFKIKYTLKDYQQVAVVDEIITQIPKKNHAFECFSYYGNTIAVLPILNNKFATICSFSLKQKFKINQLKKKEFSKHLEKIFKSKLGKIKKITNSTQIYPLKLKIASEVIKNRLVLLGNIAQSLHPIAAQGLNLSIRDSMILASMISNSFFLNNDPGNLDMLINYKYIRKLDRCLTIGLTDSIVNIFHNQSLPIIFGRNISLHIINKISFIKNIIAKKMLGFY